MSVPSIPPRPVRSQLAPIALNSPQVPPRPNRRQDRSVSPNRDAFARSPLHAVVFSHSRESSQNLNAPSRDESDTPQRPPSVTLPSIGQEGNEYASLEELALAEQEPQEVHTTKAIAGDLPLHAPTASVPSSTAKSRIANVTRTDSSYATPAGIGKGHFDPSERSLGGTPNNMGRSTSSLGGRPMSVAEAEEIGIPEIGVQVPMYPNAGDVQAPTPAPQSASSHHPSSSGDSPTLRRKPSREVFHGPPGSYGLHGHGILPKDPIERAWYEKHPDALTREVQGEYGPAIVEDRKDWALSSDDLNRLVRAGVRKPMGTGDSAPEGQPDEMIGYLASEEYTTRICQSSRPQSVSKHRTGSSQSHADSPLRKMSFADDEVGLQRTKSGSHHAPGSAVESEGDDDIYHIDPSRRSSKLIDVPHDLRHAIVPEDDMPILASDEVAKRPGYEYQMAAVEPELERLHQHEELSPMPTGMRSTDRPASRSNSLSAPPYVLRQQIEHDMATTPLDDVKEYEPLFPDDEKSDDRKPKSAVEQLKRPDLARHHFPSQDTWEDTPDSLRLQTTIDEAPPQEQPRAARSTPASAVFERPEAEQQRKAGAGRPKHAYTRSNLGQYAPSVRSQFNRDVSDEVSGRPEALQRFPSRDIWEDTPDELQLVTTVDSEANANESKPTPPSVPARPSHVKSPEQDSSSSGARKPPTLPDRPKPKPALPARPVKPKTRDSSEDVPLSKSISNDSATGIASSTSPTEISTQKQKPAVPARPAGGKIAALKAGFMSDLNSRLQTGPKPVKKELEGEQAPQEKAPLADARKGRAKGPQRRKPGTSPGAAAALSRTDSDGSRATASQIVAPITIWQIGGEGTVDVNASRSESEPQSSSNTLPSSTNADKDVDGAPSEPSLEDQAEPTSENAQVVEAASVATEAPFETVTSTTSADAPAEAEAEAPASESVITDRHEPVKESAGDPLDTEGELEHEKTQEIQEDKTIPAVEQKMAGAFDDSEQ